MVHYRIAREDDLPALAAMRWDSRMENRPEPPPTTC